MALTYLVKQGQERSRLRGDCLAWCLGVAVIASICCVVLDARAGANGSATAYLSWSPDSVVTDRTSVPPDSFALFLRLDGVQQVHALAVTVDWYPRVSDASCYWMISGPMLDSCGVAASLSPQAAFDGDSSYTWTLTLPVSRGSGVCVAYWFRGSGCDTVAPARFIVSSVRVQDSTGAIDDIVVQNELTILAARDVPERVVAYNAGLATLIPGATNTFHVAGRGFDEGMGVAAIGDGQVIQAESVVVESRSSLAVRMSVPETATGRLRLAVETTGGESDTMPRQILAADTTAFTGSGVNGYGWPLVKGGAGGDWWKVPGDSSWEYRPSIPDSLFANWLGAIRSGASLDSLYSAYVRTKPTPASLPQAGLRPRRIPLTGSVEPIYRDSLLFSDGFETAIVLPNERWVVSRGLETSPDVNWGLVFVGTCGPTHGLRSAHCAAGSPTPYCGTYAPNQTSILQMYESVPVTGFARVTGSCSTYVDTEPYHDETFDGMFACYSTDGGASWQWVNGGSLVYAGRDQVWRARVLFDRNVDDGSSTTIAGIKLRFLFVSNAELQYAGVYLDDIAITGHPYPNLTFATGGGLCAPVVVSPYANATCDAALSPYCYNGCTAEGYLNYTVVNNSTCAAPPFHVQLSDLLDGSHIVVVDTIAGLPPGGERVRRNVPFTGYAMGLCSYIPVAFAIDCYNEVQETNETQIDNSYTTSVEVELQASPDLMVTGFSSLTASPCAGTSVTLAAHVTNLGSASSASSTLGLYADLGHVPGEADVPTQTATVPALAVGTTARVDFQVMSSAPGSHVYYLLADQSDVVFEMCGEENNAYGPVGVTWSGPRPDLVMGAPQAVSGLHLVGHSTTVTLTVSNDGGASTPASWFVDWYRNLDTPPTPGQRGNRILHVSRALAPGHDTTLTISVVANTPQTWHMYAQADAGQLVAECGARTNNVAGPSTIVWESDSLVMRGCVTYRDTGYVSPDTLRHALPFARVALYDHDWSGAADLLGATCTDADGNFAFALSSRKDADECDTIEGDCTVDPYVVVSLDTGPACLGEPVVTVCHRDRTTWSLVSPWREEPSGAVVEFSVAALAPQDYPTRSAMHLYDVVTRAHLKLAAAGVQPVDGRQWHTTVLWDSTFTGWNNTGMTAWLADTLYVAGDCMGNFTPDEWDDGAVLHEYGHAIAHMLNIVPNLPGAPAGGCPHDPQRPAECPPGTPSARFAWEEGFASFVACVAQADSGSAIRDNAGAHNNNGGVWIPQDGMSEDAENGTVSLNGYVVEDNTDGVTYELANCGVLWDLYDSAVDSHHSGCGDSLAFALTGMVSVLDDCAGRADMQLGWYYHYFWERYAQNAPDVDRQLTALFCEHGVAASDGSTTDVENGGIDGQRISFGARGNPGVGLVRFMFTVPDFAAGRGMELSVFDVCGRCIRRFAELQMGPGTHELVWDGRDNAGAKTGGGVYFCRLRLGDALLTTRVVLLR